jgi:hydroxymethylpyrimidine/phosphomethylpyrimidine kinase
VLDPVMVATYGRQMMAPDTVAIVRERLFPLAACVTPNIDEAAALLGKAPAVSEAQMIIQARALLAFGSRSVLVKGGHAALDQAIDVLVWQGGVRRFSASWLATPNRDGTGCPLSAAIAAGLASGLALEQAVERAKTYLTGALIAGAGRRIGHGNGPPHHCLNHPSVGVEIS